MRIEETPSEAELLLTFREGTTSSLVYLYNKYYNSVVFFSHSLIKDRQQAEDIALESFVKLWQKREEIASMGKLRGYLFTLARNACLDYLKHGNVKARAQETLLQEAQLSEGEIEANLVASDLMRLIYAEIKSLPDAYREVLELLYLNDLTSAEAADKLGISMENLRQRKGRAIKHLRVELVKKGISHLTITLFFL
ncbi:RNA polymerase sigma factor [Chitinophaga defluvii]|uniref:RNA polymerase sigma-70 factor n=1 Tax=Chitinophaga defluvii TaxID=3163343 RepID=A0ABV2SZ68_9BACT